MLGLTCSFLNKTLYILHFFQKSVFLCYTVRFSKPLLKLLGMLKKFLNYVIFFFYWIIETANTL